MRRFSNTTGRPPDLPDRPAAGRVVTVETSASAQATESPVDAPPSEEAAPVYGARSDGGRLRAPVAARVLALGLALGCLAVLVTAASIGPSREGYGSHTGLGLPSCQFMERTG